MMSQSILPEVIFLNFAGIYHRETPDMCYPLDNDRLVVNLKTGKDVDAVFLIYEDPFAHHLQLKFDWKDWSGKREKMTLSRELEHQYIWSLTLAPKFKRLMYYFEIEADNETYCLLENHLCKKQEMDAYTRRYFKYACMNPSDLIAPPKWAEDTIWYHIFPDRFCRDANAPVREYTKPWEAFTDGDQNYRTGGTIKGITEKLDYIKELGFNGIFLTPLYKSDSNHKYNPYDYTIDPDFGTEDDMREMVAEAHKRGIRVMLDSVFNQCGSQFVPWLDVKKNGKASKYYHWFFINSDDFADESRFTDDGRYYTFSFFPAMPKLNTNNPEVIRYFTDLCIHWATDWDLDALRFDVGEEVSHTFIKHACAALREAKPDIFIPAEIWMDSITWLDGGEFDSVTNFPFTDFVTDFWSNKALTAKDFMYRINAALSRYPEQVNRVMFNFVDSHDMPRVNEVSENYSVVLQKLVLLMTMTGTPFVYYGTELAMKGTNEPTNRACMPWDKIDNGDFEKTMEDVKQLTALRTNNAACKEHKITYQISEEYPRLISYIKNDALKVVINACDKDCPVARKGKIIYANQYADGTLAKDGVVVFDLNG